MNSPFSQAELGILRLLDGLVNQESARSRIDPIVAQVERKLDDQPDALLTWEPITGSWT